MLSAQYVAGFFDGEGTVSLIYTKVRAWKNDPTKYVCGFRFVVGAANTYRPVLEALKEQFDGDISSAGRQTQESHKPVWAWKILGKERIGRFLTTVAPHCIIKSRQIELGFSYLDTLVHNGGRLTNEAWEERLRIFKELRALNQRGIVKAPRTSIPACPTEGWNPKKRGYTDQQLSAMMEHVRARRA